MKWRVLGAGVFGLGTVVGATLPGGNPYPASAETTMHGTGTAEPAAVIAVASPQAAGVPVGAGQADSQQVLEAVLAGMRGADAVACELALMALDGRSFGWSSVRSDVEGTTVAGAPVRQLAELIMSPPRDDDRMIPPLREALASPDTCVRRTAARLLGRIRSDAAVATLLEGLGRDDPLVRHAAAIGLGMAERPATAPRLRRSLADDHAPVRAAAAWALGEIEDSASVPDLIRALERDPDGAVRKAAAWALGRIE